MQFRRASALAEKVSGARAVTLFNTASVREDFNDVITVLRLFKSGLVIARYIRSDPITWALKAEEADYWVDSYLISSPPGFYELNKSEELSFLKLWRRFKIIKRKVSLKEDNYLNMLLSGSILALKKMMLKTRLLTS